jgi:5'-nucleotidase
VGTTTAVFARGGNIERRQEVPLGDLIADGMRWRYGTQLALMNGGGIRSTMPSCSYAPVNTSLRRPCTGYAAGPPFDIVLGDVFSVLPFGNILNTRTVTGAQLWTALENGVSRIDASGNGTDGRFPQISGFKFTFHYLNPVGSRVTSVTLDDGTPIPNSASATYTLALPNFVNLGGDGYTMFADGQGATQELDAVVMKEYMAFAGPSFDPASFPLDRITKLP